MCWSIFFNKVADLQAYNFIKKRLQQRCFPVKFAKFLRTSFFGTPPVAASGNPLIIHYLPILKEGESQFGARTSQATINVKSKLNSP